MHTTIPLGAEQSKALPQVIARLQYTIRVWLILMIVGLVISGATAIPLLWGIEQLFVLFGPGTLMAAYWPAMSEWIVIVEQAIRLTNAQAPLMFYGTDWLAFAHVVIAIAFIGPLRDPIRNIWVIEFGLIACVLVIPMALIFGPLRGIPFFWQVIDCSFGVGGFIPLWIVRQNILRLAQLPQTTQR
jgi:hypothetical protein